MSLLAIATALLPVCLPPAGPPAQGTDETLLLAGGTVHGTQSTEPEIADVLIEGGRVVAVGPDLERPQDCRVVDAAGWHLVPGLIDALAYHDVAHDPLYTQAGVTLIVDHGNDLARIFEAREAAAPAGEKGGQPGARWAGPSLWIAGAVLDGLPPSTSEALILRHEHDAEELLRVLFEEGVDFVSVQSGAPPDAWRKVIELAHAQGRQVWGPLPRAVTLDEALAAGVDGILFLDALLPAGQRWDEVEQEAFDAIVARVAESGVRLVPLLSGNVRVFVDQGDDAPDLARLGPEFASQWLGDLELRRGSLLTEEFAARGRRVLETQGTLVRRLYEAGVTLVPGSGAPHPWLLPGAGLVNELALWRKAGIPAADCLRLATSGAAEALGIADRGRIAPGTVADIVALPGDPREDLEHLRRPAAVVLRGSLFDRDMLDSMESDLLAAQARARELAKKPIEVAQPQLPEGQLLLAGYAESSSLGVRHAAERWAVVETGEDELAFVARRRVRRGADQAPVDLEIRQNLKAKRLVSFEVHLGTARHHLQVKGLLTANMMRVERRVDGAFVDLQSTQERIAGVDVGSLSTLVLLGHTREGDSRFQMLRFHEALELEVVRWSLLVDERGGHVFSTPDGPKLAAFDLNGAPLVAREQTGSGVRETLPVVEFAEPGLPLPAAKRARIEAARAAAEAAAPSSGDDQDGTQGDGKQER